MTLALRILGLASALTLCAVFGAGCDAAKDAQDKDSTEAAETAGPEIRSDDFESGDTSGWSDTVSAESDPPAEAGLEPAEDDESDDTPNG